MVAEHCPHAPDKAPDVWHAGVAPPHSPSPPHARQVCVPPSQIGAVPLQSAFATQRTQVPEPTSHTGVAPVHATALPAEHWPHRPLGWQAGVAPPPQSPSPVQPRHVWLFESQTGVVPEQSASARQVTHVPVDVRQSGVAPVQRNELFAEHCPHVPPG